MRASQARRSAASRPGGTWPSPATSARATIRAWSVSSVTRPAGSPRLISLASGPGSNQRSPSYSRSTVARGRYWVGMPSASPTARPSRAPSARSTAAARDLGRTGGAARSVAPGPGTGAPRAVVVQVEVRRVEPAGDELDHLAGRVAPDGEELQPGFADLPFQRLGLGAAASSETRAHSSKRSTTTPRRTRLAVRLPSTRPSAVRSAIRGPKGSRLCSSDAGVPSTSRTRSTARNSSEGELEPRGQLGHGGDLEAQHPRGGGEPVRGELGRPALRRGDVAPVVGDERARSPAWVAM